MYSCINEMLGDDGALEVCILGCQMFDLAMVERQKANFEMFFFFFKAELHICFDLFYTRKNKIKKYVIIFSLIYVLFSCCYSIPNSLCLFLFFFFSLSLSETHTHTQMRKHLAVM